MRFWRAVYDMENTGWCFDRTCPRVLVTAPRTSFHGAPLLYTGQVAYTFPEEGAKKRIYGCYNIDWSKVEGDALDWTNLTIVRVQSGNDLSCATLTYLAVDKERQLVVAKLVTDFWASSRNDYPNWVQMLRNEYPAATEIEELRD